MPPRDPFAQTVPDNGLQPPQPNPVSAPPSPGQQVPAYSPVPQFQPQSSETAQFPNSRFPGRPYRPAGVTADMGQAPTTGPIASAPFVMPDHPGQMGRPPRRTRRRLVLAGVTIAAVLCAATGGYVFGIYLPATPQGVYKASLANTAAGIDTLISYTHHMQQMDYKGAAFDGSMKLKSSSGSFDIDAKGAFDGNSNADVQFTADVMGEHASASLRSVHEKGNDSPDVYFQVNGIKNYLDSLDLNELDKLDGQWIAIDHTLIDTEKRSAEQMLNAGNSNVNTPSFTEPTSDQLYDAELKVQAVNRQYLFTTDRSKAVPVSQKFVGKETSDGYNLDHYLVGYDKGHLEAYAGDLGKALDSSKLNDWSKKVSDGQSLSSVMDFDGLKRDIKNAKGDYTFDLWADTDMKVVRKLAFTDPSDKSVFTLSQGYKGGSQYPLTMRITGKDEQGNPEDGAFGITLDTAANKVSGTFSDTSKDDGDTQTLDLSYNVTPNNNTVKVSAPTGAKPVTDILDELGLGAQAPGGLPGGSTTPPGQSLGGLPPLLFQQ